MIRAMLTSVIVNPKCSVQPEKPKFRHVTNVHPVATDAEQILKQECFNNLHIRNATTFFTEMS